MIYEYEGNYGAILRIETKEFFMAVRPDGSLVVQEVTGNILRPRLAGKSWGDVVAPPTKEEFTYRSMESFLDSVTRDTYIELLDEYSDELDYNPYSDDDEDYVLPWGIDVRMSARRIFVRRILASKWAKSEEGWNKGIAFANNRVSQRQVSLAHRQLYGTEEIEDCQKHTKATLVATLASKMMLMLEEHRKVEYARVRPRTGGDWGK